MTILKCNLCGNTVPNSKHWRRDVQNHMNEHHHRETIGKRISCASIKEKYFVKLNVPTK